MSDRLSKEAEGVLEIFTDYLNEWHEEDRDLIGPTITRADYDDDQYDLHPRVLLDHIEGDTQTRIIRIWADPFHDEGGPNILTAFYSRPAIDWELDLILQWFDTTYEVVYKDGQLRGPSGMIQVEERG